MLEHEIELLYLTKTVRSLQICVGVLVCAVAFLAFEVGQRIVHADSIPDTLTTKKLVIVDGSGNQTIVLGPTTIDTSIPGNPAIPLDNGNAVGLSMYTAPSGAAASQSMQTLFLGTGTYTLNKSPEAVELFQMNSTDHSAVATITSYGNQAQNLGWAIFRGWQREQKSVNGSASGVGSFSIEARPGTGSLGVMSMTTNKLNQGVTASSVIGANPQGAGVSVCPPPNAACGPFR
jgi:hypothetical protein